MNPLNPTDRLTVELEAQQWNQALMLMDHGMRAMAALLPLIQQQLQNPRDDERQVTPFPREAG
jgi:hypothetical protein